MTITGEVSGRSFTIETLPADVLDIDPTVQRALNMGRVRRMADNFHEAALGVLIVSARTNSFLPEQGGTRKVRYVVLDGQTRLAAIRLFAGTEKTKMPVTCQVFTGLTRQQEAEIFLEHNDRAAVRKIDLFRLALVAQQPWAVELHDIAARHGFEISDTAPKTHRMLAVTAAQRIVKLSGGKDALNRALDLIVRTWGHRENAASAEAIEGLGLLYQRHGADAVDTVRFSKKLASKDTPQTFKAGVLQHRAAFRGVSRYEAAYGYVVSVYNMGLRTNRLDPHNGKA